MSYRTIGFVGLATLTAAWIAPFGCSHSDTPADVSSTGAGGAAGGGGGPIGTPVAAEDLCKKLATIACKADDACCDGKKAAQETGSGGAGTAGQGGAGGASAGGANPGSGGAAPKPAPVDCLTRQLAACTASLGKLVTDPRTGYDPAQGGALVAKVAAAGDACFKDLGDAGAGGGAGGGGAGAYAPLPYDAFAATLRGTGKAGASCTPDDGSVAALRVAAFSCADGTRCHIYLRADGAPEGVCEKPTDDGCSHPLDCAAGSWCDLPADWKPGVWGQCRPLRANGWSCSSDLECESYLCSADGKCVPPNGQDLCLTVLYSSAVAADRPLGYWRLDETSGTVSADASGRKHDGDRAGSPATITPGALAGDPDRATFFDGVDDKITAPAALPADATAFSVELWVSSAADSGGHPVLSFGNADAGGPFLAITDGDDGLKLDLVDTSGASHAAASQAGSLTPGGWHHVVATYDGSHGALYLDGVKAADVDGTFAPRINGSLDIGASSDDKQVYKGGIDEVALYSGALGPGRIAAHHDIGKNGPTAPRWRPFDWFR
jgi:hypothetical protein